MTESPLSVTRYLIELRNYTLNEHTDVTFDGHLSTEEDEEAD